MAEKDKDCCNNLTLKKGPGPLRPLKLQDVIDRLENRIIALEAEHFAMHKERVRSDKKRREMEMHIRKLGRS